MFLVVFRNRKRGDIDHAAYGAEAEMMEANGPPAARLHLVQVVRRR